MDNYKKAIDELLIEIAKKIPQEHVKYPIKAYIVGGVANYLYTQARVSVDNTNISDYINKKWFIWKINIWW